MTVGYGFRGDNDRRRHYSRNPQEWQVGATVNVGFLKGFVVTGKIPTPGDYCPDIWMLERNGVAYEFQPHLGLRRAS